MVEILFKTSHSGTHSQPALLQRQGLHRGGLPGGHMSEVKTGATVPALTDQRSGVSKGSLGTQSDGLWDGLFWAAQGMGIQRRLAGQSVSFTESQFGIKWFILTNSVINFLVLISKYYLMLVCHVLPQFCRGDVKT